MGRSFVGESLSALAIVASLAGCAGAPQGNPLIIAPDASPLPDGSIGPADAAPDGALPDPEWEWSATFGVGCPLALVGTASCATDGVTVNSSAAFSRGGVYANLNPAIDEDDSFRVEFSFVVDQASSPAADGFVFVMRDPAAPALGAAAGALGYQQSLPDALESYPAVKPSVGIEFDTWFNEGDPVSSKHIALLSEGSVANHLAWKASPVDWSTGAEVHAWVDYSGTGDALRVYVSNGATKPELPLFSHNIDVPSVTGDTVSFGFTGSTGQYVQRVRVTSWRISVYD